MKERLRDRGTLAVLALAATALVLLSTAMVDTGGDEDIALAYGFWICVAVTLLGVVAVHTVRMLRLPRSNAGDRQG